MTEPIIEPIIEPTMESSYCAELEANSTLIVPQVVVCTLPLNDGSDFEVTQEFVAELAPLYPNVDVVQALRAMKGWLIGNQKRRKTRRALRRLSPTGFRVSRISHGQQLCRSTGRYHSRGHTASVWTWSSDRKLSI